MSRRRHLSARAGDYLRALGRLVAPAVPPVPAESAPVVRAACAIGEREPVPAAAPAEQPSC